MEPYVEHANITIKDINQTIRFITTAIPEFQVRHQGETEHYRWCHVGTEHSYLALQEVVARDSTDRQPYVDVGINHIGLVIDDVDAAKSRLLAAGYRENPMAATAHPWRKRIYFFDSSDVEWEFIEYLTDDAAKKNDYQQ
ncbi:lactoylglutathione lyase [Photobacterium jeanii]|uniref:Lactoylglutathione lyase n=1 Tax=Photobacterium jeanii TaxID=858640 RepID=A0A178KBM9_9GAMM|nr:VOC family protein [Photobacterium jeanii]OAN14114.1 lactoylglutathione lyase [Photobacterium jeanii]PST89631.1 VOC family protein [Photobacterium jeanii]